MRRKPLLFLIIPIAFLCLNGCGTPPNVKLANKVLGQALTQSLVEWGKVKDALLSDLLTTSLSHLSDSKIAKIREVSKDNQVPLSDLETILNHAAQQEQRIRDSVDNHRLKIATADTNLQIAIRIQEAIQSYLERDALTEEDIDQLSEMASDIYGELNKAGE